VRIALVGNACSVHIERWVKALGERGHEVHQITANESSGAVSHGSRHMLPFRPPFGYYLNAIPARVLLGRIQPDLVHAHYASGYGTLMRLSGYRPYILSVWGSDVFEYPEICAANRRRVQKNLFAAGAICSTSHAMVGRVRELCPDTRDIHVTPFGVDIKQFTPRPNEAPRLSVTVGTVKTLNSRYGIDVLIRAFALARGTLLERHPDLGSRLRLRLVGEGDDKEILRGLARNLGIGAITTFVGQVSHCSVAEELRKLDVYVAVSRCAESFGVAVLEASSCGVAVVVSDRGGLPEVVVDGETGMVVPAEDVERTAAALLELVTEPARAIRMGIDGRRFVERNYNWSRSVDIMENVYGQFLSANQ